jgi:hypothetical protein
VSRKGVWQPQEEEVPREHRLLKSERDGELHQRGRCPGRGLGTAGSRLATHFYALLLPMLPARALSLLSQESGAPPFRKPLQFIVITVMSVMWITFPYTYGVFYMTVNCRWVWGPSSHRHGGRHGEIGLGKRYSRYHDSHDAHDGGLREFSRQGGASSTS